MVDWNPGSDPFPDREIKAITDFEFLDDLRFIRRSRPLTQTPKHPLWQLTSPFRARMILHPKAGRPYRLTIKAPRGLYTDLSSVPEPLWSFVGPIGPHLEASILHDYLYLAWTDFRETASKRDWNFADAVFLAGMRASRVPKRRLIHAVVHSPIGWSAFRKRHSTLKQRMDEWLPHLSAQRGANG